MDLNITERLQNERELQHSQTFLHFGPHNKMQNAIKSSSFSMLSELHHAVNRGVAKDGTACDEPVGSILS
jgi:hypothetical protein